MVAERRRRLSGRAIVRHPASWEAMRFASTRFSQRLQAKWGMSVGQKEVDRIRAQALVLRAPVLVTSAESFVPRTHRQPEGRIFVWALLYGDIWFCF